MRKQQYKKSFKRNLSIIASLLVILLGGLYKADIISVPQNIDSEYISKDITEQATDLEPVTLLRVVDGDTIVVKNAASEEIKVRFLEVNTPESVHADEEKNNEYGKMASEWTKEQLAGYETVYLQYDKEKIDRYDRTLAYIWLKEDVDVSSEEDLKNYCLNAKLLEAGMAECVIYDPNVMYKDIFQALECSAIDNNVGLWQYEGYRKVVGK